MASSVAATSPRRPSVQSCVTPRDVIIIGDVGGTNIRLAAMPLASLATDVRHPPPLDTARFRTADFGHLSEALLRFSGVLPTDLQVVACALSVCGPVVDGVAMCLADTMGAEGWRLDEAELASAMGLPASGVSLLNDFVAVGMALPSVPAAARLTIHAGQPIEGRPIACLGPGTGLGQCFGVWPRGGDGGLEVCPSEGGESDFVPRTAAEWRLREHIARTLGISHVKVEHVVSGSGLQRVWEWCLCERQQAPPTQEQHVEGEGARRKRKAERSVEETTMGVEAAIRSSADIPGAIAARGTAGVPGADPTCIAAVDVFVEALGAEAANLALRFQALGGVYIAGGVAAKLSERLTGGERLRNAYLGKGRSVAAYDGCPLYLVTATGDDLGMAGAWAWARSVGMGAARPQASVASTVSSDAPCIPPLEICPWRSASPPGDTPLEICIDSVASAEAARAGGAARLELCASLVDGGTTPSLGMVREVVGAAAGLPVHVMVRPRAGDFAYTPAELRVMRAEIREFRQVAGVDGVVLGCLRTDGTVDEPVLRELVQCAAPLAVTFHRAIDVSRDPIEAVRACVRCGVARVLSSGGAAQALDGAHTLKAMKQAAAGRLAIAAGGGVTEANAAALLAASSADELHGSLRAVVRSAMTFRPSVPIPMGTEKRYGPETEYETHQTSRQRVADVATAVTAAVAESRG